MMYARRRITDCATCLYPSEPKMMHPKDTLVQSPDGQKAARRTPKMSHRGGHRDATADRSDSTMRQIGAAQGLQLMAQQIGIDFEQVA